MPFNQLQRRDSWPPTVVHLRADEEPSDIDDDPFSFFLTSPEDIDDFPYDDDEDLSAGIETPESRSPVREVSPSAIQRISLFDDDDDDESVEFGLAMPLSLKDFSLKHSSGRKSRAGQRIDDLKGLGIALPAFSPPGERGRATVRLTPRGRGQTRSLSARKPKSWRLPSPEIYSIQEERESEDEKKEESRDVVVTPEIVSMSAPATVKVDQFVIQTPVKPKKRVHWAC